ncbi:hypothetical protein B0H14DRAFT_2567750 [Mycena olivaceomarginata]|nr:hypothetical protein B0H14DRAFT_2567750 [Mycena olivaceomarginata]
MDLLPPTASDDPLLSITTAYSAQSDLPLAEKQLDRLVGMVQTLMQDNLELKRDMRGLKDNHELREHLVSLESTDARSTSGRGIAANRGRVTRANVSRNARKRQMTAHDSGDSDIDPALLDTVSDATTEGSETGITDSEAGNDVDFSPGERKALQKYTTKAVRRLCHVSTGTEWPDPNLIRPNTITHEIYPTPF